MVMAAFGDGNVRYFYRDRHEPKAGYYQSATVPGFAT
jgi:hypothetical protein